MFSFGNFDSMDEMSVDDDNELDGNGGNGLVDVNEEEDREDGKPPARCPQEAFQISQSGTSFILRIWFFEIMA